MRTLTFIALLVALSGCTYITGGMKERAKEETTAAHNTARAAYCRGTTTGVLLRMEEKARASFLEHCAQATDNGQN